MATRSRSTSALLVGEIGFGENREGEGEGHGEGWRGHGRSSDEAAQAAAEGGARDHAKRSGAMEKGLYDDGEVRGRALGGSQRDRSAHARAREREIDRWGGWEGLARGEPKWRRGRSIEEASRAATLARSTSARLARAQRGTKIAALAERGR